MGPLVAVTFLTQLHGAPVSANSHYIKVMLLSTLSPVSESNQHFIHTTDAYSAVNTNRAVVEAAGIEPTSQGPKSWVLPLNDASMLLSYLFIPIIVSISILIL